MSVSPLRSSKGRRATEKEPHKGDDSYGEDEYISSEDDGLSDEEAFEGSDEEVLVYKDDMIIDNVEASLLDRWGWWSRR